MSTGNYIQIPPDSTGKKLRNRETIDVKVDELSEDVDISTISIGTNIIGEESGTIGSFIGFSLGIGEISIYLNSKNGNFIPGENLISTNLDLVICKYISDDIIHTQQSSLVDCKSPGNSLKIDSDGSAQVNFKGGDPNIDVFGFLQTSQSSNLDSHNFIYSDTPDKYVDINLNGGEITHSTSSSSITLKVDSSVDSYTKRRSRTIYPHETGVGNNYIASVAIGDEGKDNVVRRWGLGTDTDGVYFEIFGTEFNVVIRNSSTGSIVESKVPRELWNGDKLDNENRSSFILDISKFNLYFIDYQWLGVGLVKFGVISPHGDKIPIHTFWNANKSILPWSSISSFPIFFEQFNTDITASSSEMKSVCVAISRQNSDSSFTGSLYDLTTPETKDYSGTASHLFSAKFKETINGRSNYMGILPTILDVYTEKPSIIEIWANPTLDSPNFDYSPHDNSAIDVDFSDISVTPVTDKPMRTIITGTGYNRYNIAQDNLANIIFNIPEFGGIVITWTIRTIVPIETSKAFLTLEYKEIK